MTSVDEDQNAFLQAAESGEMATLRRLLDSGVDVNCKVDSVDSDDSDWNGSPALVIASTHGHASAVRLLLDRGADVDKKLEWSALLVAATQGHFEIVKLLIAAGAKSECKYSMGKTNPLPACANEQPLTQAHMDIIKLLIRGDYDINSQDVNGHTALMNAVYRNNMDLFRLLIGEGANVNARASSSEKSSSVLDDAARYGRLEMVRLLLRQGANIKHEARGYTPLHNATKFNKVDVAKLLLDAGCSAEASETGQSTALHTAAAYGASDSLKLLLNTGFRTDAKSLTGGLTPLLEAARWCRIHAVQLLLDAGANVNAQDDKGWTALHHSTFLLNYSQTAVDGEHSYPRLKILRLLMSYGADLTIIDNDGMTILEKIVRPFQYPHRRIEETVSGALEAAPKGDIEGVKLLLGHGANVHHQDMRGMTVLHRAAHEWNIELINMLLRAGANIEAETKNGSTTLFETVIMVTGDQDDPPVVRKRCLSWVSLLAIEVLLDAGANINARMKNKRTLLHELVQNLDNWRGLEHSIHRRAILLLLSRGVDVNAIDSNRETAQQLAERLAMPDVVELLNDHS